MVPASHTAAEGQGSCGAQPWSTACRARAPRSRAVRARGVTAAAAAPRGSAARAVLPTRRRAALSQPPPPAAPPAPANCRRERGRAVASVLAEGGEAWWAHGSDLPNERAVQSTQELLDALSRADDALVVVHFYAPWCGACKALHPKLVQIISQRSDIQFLKVDFDANKQMCRTLGVKVLPMFHMYRGASGRVAEFSASLSKIQRLRDALDEHGAARCSLEPSTPPLLPAELLQ